MAAQTPTFAQQAGRAASTASGAYGAVTQVAGVAGMAATLPWQTIVAGETPDLRAMLSRAVVPDARTLVRRPLRKPSLAMAVAVALDLLVAGISGGTGARAGALARAVGGGVTALLSLITGSKGGALRSITGAVSLVTALVQVISLGITLVAAGELPGADAEDPSLTIAPAGVRALNVPSASFSVSLERKLPTADEPVPAALRASVPRYDADRFSALVPVRLLGVKMEPCSDAWEVERQNCIHIIGEYVPAEYRERLYALVNERGRTMGAEGS